MLYTRYLRTIVVAEDRRQPDQSLPRCFRGFRTEVVFPLTFLAHYRRETQPLFYLGLYKCIVSSIIITGIHTVSHHTDIGPSTLADSSQRQLNQGLPQESQVLPASQMKQMLSYKFWNNWGDVYLLLLPVPYSPTLYPLHLWRLGALTHMMAKTNGQFRRATLRKSIETVSSSIPLSSQMSSSTPTRCA